MEAFLSPNRPVNKYYGVYPAIVVENVDPEQRYRVKVKFPWLMESEEKYTDTADKEEMRSSWCRISSPMMGTVKHEAGAEDGLRGCFWLPEIDDEVLVVFAFGDFREAIVIGQMSNGQDLPFWQNKEDKGVQIAEKNNLRGIRSRSGHMVTFVDDGKDKAEKIVIQTKVADKNVYDQPALGAEKTIERAHGGGEIKIEVPDGDKGTHLVNLDMTDKKEHILISDKKGELLIKFDSVNQTIILYSEKDIVIHAKNEVAIKCKDLKVESEASTAFKAGSTWKQESTSTMDLKSAGTMTLDGKPSIELNP
jgi:uncharacterized protein involved in type VI secretion and phage assembly